MTTKVALISCSNGLGHLRRLLLQAQELKLRGVSSVLFAPFNSVIQLSNSMEVTPPEVVDFDSNTKISNWLDGSAIDWYKKLPNINRFDRVVSDNLIEILYLRPDAYISGSFFWHEALSDFPQNLRDESRRLLKIHSPNMISSKIFSSNYLRDFTQLYEVGLYGERRFNSNSNINNNCLLISCGKGGNIVERTRDFVHNIEKNPFKKIYVEPDVLPHNPPDWMLPATYTKAMYDELSAAIIRPGLGTVTDVLLSTARIFAYYEQGNHELIENSSRILEYDIGSNSGTIENAWEDACDYANNFEKHKTHYNNISKLNYEAEKQAVDIILS